MAAVVTAFLFGSCFATKPVFFQHLLTAKQWQLEQGVLLTTAILIVTLPFIRNIRITAVDTGVFLLSSWLVSSAFFIHHPGYQPRQDVLFHVLLWLTVYLFVRNAAGSGWFHYSMACVFLSIALLQSILGLMQLYGFENSYHGLFKITGTFHNPGPFSGFVVSVLPLAVVGYTFGYTERHGGDTEKLREISLRGVKFNFNPRKIFRDVFRGFSLLTIIAILLIVPAAQSRAAWLAGAIGCLYVLLANRERFPVIKRLSDRFRRLNVLLRTSIIVIGLLFILGAATGIYLLKKDSANGRLLIWQVTSQLIKERPITGHGSGAFSALYMDQQANWFESGKGAEAQAMVAGSPEAPFNEPLKLWLEKGLIGILLAGGILGVILFLPTPPDPLEGEPQPRKASTRNSELETRKPETLLLGLKGTLLSILTFSLFSYPFDISSFTLQLVVVVALLSSATPALTTIKGRKSLLLTMPIVVLLIAGGIWFLPKRQAHYTALKTWNEANQFYPMQSYDISTEAYAEAFPVLQYNGLFLQMYGKALSMNEQQEKSNEILTMAQNHLSSYIINNALGDNHQALGNYKIAETAYRKSTFMVPGMLLPKYLLAKLYMKSDQNRKAQQT
ncbi:MAG TPA: O-antigen ligase family protein, partial [Bacteroidales bacterium]|nr:O-antigen ligase family protein [Bacteroidales bacterium]